MFHATKSRFSTVHLLLAQLAHVFFLRVFCIFAGVLFSNFSGVFPQPVCFLNFVCNVCNVAELARQLNAHVFRGFQNFVRNGIHVPHFPHAAAACCCISTVSRTCLQLCHTSHSFFNYKARKQSEKRHQPCGKIAKTSDTGAENVTATVPTCGKANV